MGGPSSRSGVARSNGALVDVFSVVHVGERPFGVCPVPVAGEGRYPTTCGWFFLRVARFDCARMGTCPGAFQRFGKLRSSCPFLWWTMAASLGRGMIRAMDAGATTLDDGLSGRLSGEQH